jgi:hypothetical protein
MSLTPCGPGSVGGIANGYGLDGPGIESRWKARFSAPVHTGPGAQPASCTMGTGSFPGVKSGRGVTLTPHPLLVPWSWKSSTIPLLPLSAIRPVHSLSACTRVHFNHYHPPTVYTLITYRSFSSYIYFISLLFFHKLQIAITVLTHYVTAITWSCLLHISAQHYKKRIKLFRWFAKLSTS